MSSLSPRAGFPPHFSLNRLLFIAFCYLTALICSHSCSCSTRTSPPLLYPTLSALPPTPGSRPHCSSWTLPLSSIHHSNNDRYAESCRSLCGTIQSCGAEWQRVSTICDIQSCKQLISSCLPLYLTGHGWMEGGVSFSQQWYQAELRRREAIHIHTTHTLTLTLLGSNVALVSYWLY